MPSDDRNDHVENLTVTDSFTDPGGTQHTGSLDGGGGSSLNVENTDGTTLLSTSTLQAGTDLEFVDDGDGTATLNYTGSGGSFSGDHADLTNVQSDQHHAKYTDSEAVTAVNNDTDHGSTAQHDYFSGDHTALTNVQSDQHHAKTQPSDIDSTNWNDYEIQVDGTDGAGIINFKTQ